MRHKDMFVNYLGSKSYVVFTDPDTCPMCGKSIEPVYKGGFADNNNEISVYYYCNGCNNSFISRFNDPQIYENDKTYKRYKFYDSFPKTFISNSFSQEISSLSPRFVDIYNQSLQAESLQLNEICGMGYRKALEFLIYDYVLQNNLATEEDLKKLELSKVIDKHLDNDVLKNLAKGSAWLGNDQTHYFVKHDDYNIQDLKKYISSAVSLLEGQIRAKQLTTDLLNRKK